MKFVTSDYVVDPTTHIYIHIYIYMYIYTYIYIYIYMYIYIYSVPAQETAKDVQSFVERRCSNEAKTRNPLRFAGVPQTPEESQPFVGRSSPCHGTCGGDIAV